MEADGDGPDSSSIKPVSSLRSKFESINIPKPAADKATIRPLSPFKTPVDPRTQAAATKKRPPTPPAARRSFDAGRQIAKPHVQRKPDVQASPRSATNSPTRWRPQSMIEHSPPRVNVTSPASPPRAVDIPSSDPLQTLQAGPTASMDPLAHPPTILPPRQLKVPSRTSTPVTNSSKSANVSGVDHSLGKFGRPSSGQEDPAKAISSNYGTNTRSLDTRNSPFSTPPGSDDDLVEFEGRPSVPVASKPSSTATLPKKRVALQTFGDAPSQAIPHRPPRTSSAAMRGSGHSRQRSETVADDVADAREARPMLPLRRELGEATVLEDRRISTNAPSQNSMDASSRSSALAQGFSRELSIRKASQPLIPPREDSRSSSSKLVSEKIPSSKMTPDAPRLRDLKADRSSVYETLPPTAAQAPLLSGLEFPDSSRVNRRAPWFRDGPRMIPTGYDTRLFDICGEFVCTTGVQTRIWNLLTGKLILSMSHGEQVRITAVSFKPARQLEDDGLKVWLGTNWGELHELDIALKRVTAINEHAHSRREIVEIHRKTAEIWTRDNEGKLIVWPPEADGSPSLENGVLNGRVPRGCTTSIVVDDQLWLANGKALWIFRPSTNPDNHGFRVTQQSLSTPNAGEIISSAIVPNQPDRVYFGHSDGKISAFTRSNVQHLETINVNLYKVNCLVGVGDYLWAGYNTGMLQLYDTQTRPWTTKKRWLSHSQPIVSLIADQNSLWRLGRLQVVSLGIDNVIGIWDGLVEEDWLEDEMKNHEAKFCSFRNASALILTWNAGAAKPTDLRHDEKDANFFRDLLQNRDAPDIIVFGLQELVDLDDKKLTAKSFFKGKSKDSYGQEHLSSVYRAWRDYLTGCLDQKMPKSDSYAQLHTSSLVGLFICVFVKATSRARIRDVQAAEVKTGMGGLHGNKGALIVRFILDDTSLCFVNCHLAAGQTQTVNRNHDVAAILEAEHLPVSRSSDLHNGTYVHGGDGSMITDHEICILNGDLNYRIDTMGRDTVIQAIKTKNIPKLLDRDQLLLSRRKNPGHRLRDFTEAPLTFLPTYKYDVGTDNYDSSDKRRAPAWCDRILYKGDAEAIKQLEYKRHEVRVSDHRPVTGYFKIRIRTVDQDLHAQWQQKSEEKFEGLKQRISEQTKLDYLVDVFGIDEGEATRLLRSQ